jgi:uncharacterized membrane protein YkvI
VEKIHFSGAFYGACIFLGSIIGAGFATGQEVYRFFAFYGPDGLFGVALCGILFFFICKNTFELSIKIQAPSFFYFLFEAFGPSAAQFYHVIATSFLFTVFGVMGGGMAALGKELFSLPHWVGFSVYLLIMLFVLSGSERYLAILSAILCPIMVIGVSFLCLYVLISKDISVFSVLGVRPFGAAPAMSALLYCGYNSLFCIPILSTLYRVVPNQNTSRFCAFLCAGVFCLCLFLITLALGGFYGEIKSLELPLLYIATLAGSKVKLVYFIVLSSAIITTGAGSGFVLKKSIGPHKWASFVLCSASVIFGLFDFSFLVKNFYGFFGFFGIVLFFLVIFENRRPRLESLDK